jgi:ABC-type transport system involved in multi-copper enzyme maturation permease subunit
VTRNPLPETGGLRPELSPPGAASLEGPAPPSPFRQFLTGFAFLVRLSFQRQARMRQMVWIALALLGFMTVVIGLNTVADRWGMGYWRWGWQAPHAGRPRGEVPREWAEGKIAEVRFEFPQTLAVAPDAGFPAGVPWAPLLLSNQDDATRRSMLGHQRPHVIVLTYRETAAYMHGVSGAMPWSPPAMATENAIAAATQAVLDRSGFMVFSSWIVFSVFLSFLLPMWSLSFATEALGGDRESRSLIWLLTRPLSRPAIYLAKYVALLPWSLGLCVGGFGLLCVAAGRPGLVAFRLYWPAVFYGTLAFSALFHLMGACVRRPAIVAIVYTFFLETILGNLPGSLKRVSISFYTRCMMFDEMERYGVTPVKSSVYMPVDGTTALWVLVGLTVVLLGVGMVVFGRSEYREEA